MVKAKPLSTGLTTVVNRGEMGLQYLEFGLLYLPGGEWIGSTGKCEYVLDILSGVVSLEVKSPLAETFPELGQRRDVFDGLPTSIYLPPGLDYCLKVVRPDVEIAVFSAIAPGFKGQATVIEPDEVQVRSDGRDNWRWDVYLAIDDKFPAARLIVGEEVIPPGNWSNIPSAKHDAFNPPGEFPMEEVSYFRAQPKNGFGMIRIYTLRTDPTPIDEAYVVEDGDTVAIPRGYHPTVSAPGSVLHRTWAMAGQIRRYNARTYDPTQAWLVTSGGVQ